MNVMKVENVSQAYKTKVIFKNVNIAINKGEIVVLVGKNGIGKSTFLLTLIGQLKAKEGDIFYDGANILSTKQWKKAISYLPDKFQLYPFMTVYENVMFFAKLLKLEEEQVNTSLHITGMDPAKHEYVKNLSKGMLQRVGISIALLGDPDILIFDEPTSGIDFNGREDIYKILKQLGSIGKTIIFSTHHPEEIKEIATHVILFNVEGVTKVSSPSYFLG